MNPQQQNPHDAVVTRERYCTCSYAVSNRGVARRCCLLHGDTKRAVAYRAGMRDGRAGFPVPEARAIAEPQ